MPNPERKPQTVMDVDDPKYGGLQEIDDDPKALPNGAIAMVSSSMERLRYVEQKEDLANISKASRQYVEEAVKSADDLGREIYDTAAHTFVEVSAENSNHILEKHASSFERLNLNGWNNNSVAIIVNAKNKTLYVAYKEAKGNIRVVAQSTVGFGRGPLGSNVENSGGTPLGLLRFLPPSNNMELNRRDTYPIGMSKNDPNATKRPRGESYLATRWLRCEGLEPDNDQSAKRAIMLHGSAAMDREIPNKKQNSSGCIILSNADVIHLWGYIRHNLLKHQGILCDVVNF